MMTGPPPQQRGPVRARYLGRPPFLALGVAIGICVLNVAVFRSPDRFLLGGDEGFEMAKAMLINEGSALYREIWSDQPPLFTLIVATSQRLFGDDVRGPRVIAACFGATIAWAVWVMASQAGGTLAGLSAVILLLATPSFPILSLSVMQEVPFLALTMSCGVLLREWLRTGRPGYVVVSAFAFSGAVGIKLLALLAVPAVIAESLAGSSSRELPMVARVRMLTWWCVLALLGSGLLVCALGPPPASMLIGAHTVVLAEATEMHGDPSAFRFPFATFRSHSELLMGIVLLSVTLARQRGLVRLYLFPIVFAATSLLVHFFHRPTWSFYYLHFAVPAVVLAACGLTSWIRSFLEAPKRPQGFLTARMAAAGLGMIVAYMAMAAFPRIWGQSVALAQSPYPEDVKALGAITREAGAARRMFASQLMFCVHAGVPPPPRLALLSLKRFWSGQLTFSGILEILRAEKPAIVMWERNGHLETVLRDFVSADYRMAYEDETFTIWILKT